MKGLKGKPGSRGKKIPAPPLLSVHGEEVGERGKGQKNYIAYLTELGKKKPQFRELTQFYQELLEIDAQDPPTFTVETGSGGDKIVAGFEAKDQPLLKFHEYSLDQEAAENLFGRLCLWLSRRPRTFKEAEKIKQAWQENSISRTEFFRQALLRDENYFKNIAQSSDLNASLLYFLAFNCVRPAVEILANRLRSPGEETAGCSCPLCGSGPAMAELRGEEGVRYFYCSFCGSEWPGARLVCPYCQNQDQDKLRYFTVEEEKDYSVHVCELCKRYVKTLNSREPPVKMPLWLEDLITPHLDILAARAGYQRGAHNLFALQIT